MAASSELHRYLQTQSAVMTLRMSSVGKRRFRVHGFMALLLILSFFIENTGAHQFDCSSTYKEISEKHTLCRPQPPLCQVINSGVTKEEAREILNMHNKHRQAVALGKIAGFPHAANMMQLKWDDELAAVAQAHANQCQFRHDCYACRRVPRFTTGQNLFLSSSSSPNAISTNWKSAIQSWLDEGILFDFSEIDKFNGGGEAGHLTQMIWATSKYVGCGRAKFKIRGDPTYRIIYTCNYGPVGNVNDMRIYESGETCSHCPEKTTCSRSLYGLCSLHSRKNNNWHKRESKKPTTQHVGRLTRDRYFGKTFITDPWLSSHSENSVLQKVIPAVPSKKWCRCDEKLLQKMREDVRKLYAGTGIHPIVKIKCECLDSDIKAREALMGRRILKRRFYNG
ncbi:CRISP/Allergen/PR-1 isoform X2 [Ixodes scapularis]|uniref:CRISP/Allergen/PR-1 isoform X2 n=1 Tax=Ixodes scapularis TaxID=6945 RepID=UPI001A9E5ED6|nr:CRISP/Allergen/PR-1 isoform X2 [Ixodes scapularis]